MSDHDPSSSSRTLRPRKPKRKEPEPPSTKSKGKQPMVLTEEDDDDLSLMEKPKSRSRRKYPPPPPLKKKEKRATLDPNCKPFGDPIPPSLAHLRWPHRYPITPSSSSSSSQNNDEDDLLRNIECHFSMCEIDDQVYNLGEIVSVQAFEGKKNYVGRIVEIFQTLDGRSFFTAQWFYRAEDTYIGSIHSDIIDDKRIFLSDVKDDNPLDSILKTLKVARVNPNVDLEAKKASIPSDCDYYYDFKYSLSYHSFSNLPTEAKGELSLYEIKTESHKVQPTLCFEEKRKELSLLDMYSGCGAMSTGLCIGASASGVNLVTRWAVDFNEYACQSMKFNHPETNVYNVEAEFFLCLLKEWKNLCETVGLINLSHSEGLASSPIPNVEKNESFQTKSFTRSGELEVEEILDIHYGYKPSPKKVKSSELKGELPGLYFKIRWKNFGSEHDTWEPPSNLVNCQDCIKKFVRNAYRSRMLPLPGDVDVICGGPPCQGISGFNHHRNKNEPLEDEKNAQLLVFMGMVEYLQPKYVLMENVVDLMKFANGYLGRYAASRLLALDYQTRLGLMVAGCYGVPQFRMRVFLWGARPTESLPQFPLPIHDVVVRGVTPTEFEGNVVAFEEINKPKLQPALLLADAISDLPSVLNSESRDVMEYENAGLTEFQKYIRLSKEEMSGKKSCKKRSKSMLFDHRPLELNVDDFERVCHIPHHKGANFRDLAGVIVGNKNKVALDPSKPRALCRSGNFLVPNYAITFQKGTSVKPFGRLWWDEIVPTVVGRAEPHNQVILHPLQDRVLSIRENARIQGFPDHYRLFGPVKERYVQVGNAVAVPVGRALGYALGIAFLGQSNNEAVFRLPPTYSYSSDDGASTSGSASIAWTSTSDDQELKGEDEEVVAEK